MKKKWKTLFATGSGSDWDRVSELPSSVPIRKSKRTHYTPFQDWNGVVAPSDKTRTKEPLDTNMVTVTVKSSSPAATVEINKADDLEHSGGNTGRYKKKLAHIAEQEQPYMTASSQNLYGYGGQNNIF